MTSAAIQVHDLAVHAARRCLLEIDVLRAELGTIVALMGPNGAGKTTLLRTCLGLVSPTHGDILVLGQNVPTLRGSALANLRRRLGYVPQLLPDRSEMPLTVREVVAIGRTAHAGLFHALTPQDWGTVDRWIARLGLSTRADRPFSRISGGEQRKTLIARAMAQEPELLLLDEPTAHLDLGWRERIVETIQTIYTETHLTVVIVCHELEVLPPACRQVILLQEGRIAATGSPESVFTTERVSQLYGAALRVHHEAGRHAVLPQGGPHA